MKPMEQYDMFEGAHIRGITMGLMIAKQQLIGMFEDIRRHQCVPNEKQIIRAIDSMIENRIDLRDNPWAFVRCVGKGKDMKYELFIDPRAPKGYKKTSAQLKEERKILMIMVK